MDIADPPDIFKNENVRANNETLEKSDVDLLTKHQVTKASLSEHLDTIKRYSQGCEKQALNNAAKSKILCPRNGLSRIYPNERWN